MWLRLVRKYIHSIGEDYGLLSVILLLLFSSCSEGDNQRIDLLNEQSYSSHYRSLEQTESYALQALELANDYADGRAEALNHLAFTAIMRMEYARADSLLDALHTDNQIERLIATVQHMRLCQRRSRNREFYDYREKAETMLKRINEERSQLSKHEMSRLLYAESEFCIVNSTYYYYVGLERQAAAALSQLPGDLEKNDTAQWLNYLYSVGSGGIISDRSVRDIHQREFDHLMRCFLLAQQKGYTFFVGNSMEAMAELMTDTVSRNRLVVDNLPALKFINPAQVPDDQLALFLAENALASFRKFGDVYQIAGAYRTMASCYRAIGDYESALFNLEEALSVDSAIYQAPDLVASIREQLSVAYSAMDNKAQSDYNRNIYLDLQEQTRQDRMLEARAGQLDMAIAQLNRWLMALGLSIVLLIFSLCFFSYLHRRQQKKNPLSDLLTPLSEWERQHSSDIEKINDRKEQLLERINMTRLQADKQLRRNLEQRAKLSVALGITPLIDRMLHEVRQPEHVGNMDYVREVAEQINQQNDLLTQWIQLQQGQLSLHIESFQLDDLFSFLAHRQMGFRMKGLSLTVKATDAIVKADRVLTLFMINTLADNARKFTAEGGAVTIEAQERDEYVEVSVSDNGIGMTEEELTTLFDRKFTFGDNSGSITHGFGLLNCKGIIERYKKVSQFFSICMIGAESVKGQGSRFFFRLPKGVRRVLVIIALVSSSLTVGAQDALQLATTFADSAYFSNIGAQYERTLEYADSCRYYLNKYFKSISSTNDTLLAIDDLSALAPEIRWFYDSIPVNYDIILDIRNESAVAALALHDWSLYNYNNRIYTQLFKELSADSSLDDYCRTMQHSQTNKQIAVVLLLLVLASVLPAYYFIYERHRLFYRYCVERIKNINKVLLSEIPVSEKTRMVHQLSSDRMPDNLRQITDRIESSLLQAQSHWKDEQDSIELMSDELRRYEMEDARLHVANQVLDNCLSTLKHETMYYPSRIIQLLDNSFGQNNEQRQMLVEVISYYRELHGILCEQASRQTERMNLQVKPLTSGILGNENLINYLFDIIRHENDLKNLDISYAAIDKKYIGISVSICTLTDERAHNLFTPKTIGTSYLVCREIVRFHGEATGRRGCGIRAENNEEKKTTLKIILPRA